MRNELKGCAAAQAERERLRPPDTADCSAKKQRKLS